MNRDSRFDHLFQKLNRNYSCVYMLSKLARLCFYNGESESVT